MTDDPVATPQMREQSEVANMGDLGAIFALRGDRYLPRGGVRHRTRPNFLEPSTLVAACGTSASASYWRGTGSQDEYEHLASIPRCTRCISVEKP
jgi:hypothetical protein